MAHIDAEGRLCLRIVFDGAPEAGKTASALALAEGFGASVTTPAEKQGRTLFFDWLEYEGGRFGGEPIQCQLVTVPGQDEYRSRRETLLASADAVVFVADSSRSGLAPAARSLSQCRELIATQVHPAPFLVLANKRDLPEAVSLDELSAALGLVGEGRRTPVLESVATSGDGVRAAFIQAVRLAVERVRELDAASDLERSAVSEDAASLYRAMVESDGAAIGAIAAGETAPGDGGMRDVAGGDRGEEGEPGSADGVGAPAVREAGEESSPEAAAEDAEGRLDFHRDVGSGSIWPPIEGRSILASLRSDSVEFGATDDGGRLVGRGNRWLLESGDEVFDEIEVGKLHLRRWAGDLIRLQPLLPPERCLLLAEAGPSRWRIWQVVPRFPSLAESLTEVAAGEVDLDEGIRRLATGWRIARGYCRSAERLGVTLRTDLSRLSAEGGVRPLAGFLWPQDLEGRTEQVLDEILEVAGLVVQRWGPEEIAVAVRELDGASDEGRRFIEQLLGLD